MASRIVLNNISYHGKGAIENIPGDLKARGKKKVFVCTDASLVKFGVSKKLLTFSTRPGSLTKFTATSNRIRQSRTFRTV